MRKERDTLSLNEEKGISTKITILIIAIILLALGPSIIGKAIQIPNTIKITGSTTVRPIAKEWRNVYMENHLRVRVSISGGGSGQGIADVKSKRSDIGMSSSEVLIDQEPNLIKHLIAYDGIILAVNKNFPRIDNLMKTGIKKSTLKKIYTGKINNWNQVPGINLDQELYNYTRSEISGTSEAFANFLEISQSEIDGAGQHGNSGTKQAIEQDKFSIGYISAAYAFSGNIQEIPIDSNNDGKLENYEKIESYNDLKVNIENYPLKRGLYFATKKEPGESAEEFINWCKNEGQKYVSKTGYIPIKLYK